MTSGFSVGDAAVGQFQRDGVLCLRGAFVDWLDRLARGVERNLRRPGPWATENLGGDEPGRFFDDYCNWTRIPEYRDFVLDSPAAEIAARLMRSSTAQFFHEHLLIKEPGTAKRTPWHHDLPYYCVQGEQTVSLWIALDPVPKAGCPEFVVGSQRWGRLFYPRLFRSDSDYDYAGAGYETIPDIESERGRYDIRSWELVPGDAVAFSFLTVHGAPANLSAGRRRGFSARWLGDDVTFAERPGATSPPFPGIGLEPGERLREDWFPVVWRSVGPQHP